MRFLRVLNNTKAEFKDIILSDTISTPNFIDLSHDWSI